MATRDSGKAGNGKSGPPGGRRGRGFARASDLASSVMAEAGAKRGFAERKLLTRWPDLVGEEISALCRPIKIAYGSQRDAGLGAVLHLAVSGAAATEIDHRRTEIIDRVNAHYGYRAVSRIRIAQTAGGGAGGGFAEPAPGFDGPARAARRATLAAEEETALADVADARLRKALARLAANVHIKTASGAKTDATSSTKTETT